MPKTESTRVLLKDVAKAAQTSPGTVSAVLNRRKSTIRVGDATRARILAAAKDLGFRPDPIARSLRTRRTATIGVVVNGLSAHAERLVCVERLASQRGYEVLLALSRWEAEREEDEIRRLLHRRVDGLLLLSPAIDAAQRELLRSLIAEGFPLVGVGPVPVAGMDGVDADRAEAFRAMAAQMAGRGARRFAFLGWQHTPGVRERIAGIRRALEGVDGAELRVAGCPEGLDLRGVSNGEAAALIDGLYAGSGGGDDWPEAVLCQTDELALAVMQRAHARGLSVPGQVAVAGGAEQEYAALLDVPLTSVRMPSEQLVRAAMDRLIERIERPDARYEPLRLSLPMQVMPRRSSEFGAAPAAD